MTHDNYVFRTLDSSRHGIDWRLHAKVLMNAIEDIKKDDPDALNGYLCLEIMRLGYEQRLAVEDVLEPEQHHDAAFRLGAQVCESCVKFWDCDARVMTPLPDSL